MNFIELLLFVLSILLAVPFLTVAKTLSYMQRRVGLILLEFNSYS
jgi:hypothetical protein